MAPAETDDARLRAVACAARAVVACLLDVVYGDVLINNDRGLHRPGGAQELLYSSNVSDVRRGAAVRLAADIGKHIATSDEDALACMMAAEIAEWPGGDGPATFDRFTTYTNVAKAAGSEFLHAISRVAADTFAIEHMYWPVIERVASELVMYDFISAGQVRDMVLGGLHAG